MIPKLSAPLIKDIRTGEGILEWVLAAADLIAGLTGSLSIAHTVQYGVAIAVLKGARRGLLKLIALQKGAGIGSPLTPALLSSTAQFVGGGILPSAEAVLSDIKRSETAASEIQGAGGTPAQALTAGLAPSPAAPPSPGAAK